MAEVGGIAAGAGVGQGATSAVDAARARLRIGSSLAWGFGSGVWLGRKWYGFSSMNHASRTADGVRECR